MGNDITPVEQVQFAATWSNAKFTAPATVAVNKLRQMVAQLDLINGRMANMSVASFKYSAAELNKVLQQNPLTRMLKKDLTPEQVAKALGVPSVANFKQAATRARAQQAIVTGDIDKAQKRIRVLNQQLGATTGKRKKTEIEESLGLANKELERLQARYKNVNFFRASSGGGVAAGGFRDLPSAAAFSKSYFDKLEQSQLSFLGLAGKSTVRGPQSTVGGAATLGPGKITLVIPANRISATLGPGSVKVKQPTVASPQSTAQGGKGGKGSTGDSGPAAVDSGPGTLIQTQQNEITGQLRKRYASGAASQVTTDVITGGKKSGKITTTDLRTAAREALALKSEALRKDFDEQMAGIMGGSKIGRTNAINALVGNMEKQVSALAGDKTLVSLPKREVQTALAKLNTAVGKAASVNIQAIEEDAVTFQSKPLSAVYRAKAAAQAKRDKAAAKVQALDEKQAAAATLRMNQQMAVQQAIENFEAGGGTHIAGSGRMMLDKSGQWTRQVMMSRTAPSGQIETMQARLGPASTFQVIPGRARQVPHSPLELALAGLAPENMAAKFLKVAAWSAAAIPIYGAMYKSLELVTYSMQRLEKTGLEMARLGLVFRGVGGTAQELTGDVLKLAAAQGRSSDEAMESAREWARLGGDRAAVNEEVRVSAMAANLADISMLESTKQLSALMHIYHLQAGDLNGVLGMLTNTSLKYNVTLDEMFVGLDRSAAAAKVAGIGLSELQAMIGVVVGATGQSGSMTGNSIKYILQELNKPDIQKQLRGFGVEPLTNQLQQKPGGQILAELSGVYGTMGDRSQQRLAGLLGGRFNAARVPIVLEHYPEILKLAVDAQLNMNAAQLSNVAIVQSLKNELAGVKAQWDRLVMNSGALPWLTKVTEAGKHLMGDLAGADPSAATLAAQQKSRNDKMSEMVDKPHGWLATLKRVGQLTMSTGLSGVDTWTDVMLGRGFMPGAMGKGFSNQNNPGLTDFWNYGHRTKDERDQAAFDSRIQQVHGQTEAHHNQQVAFKLAGTLLKNNTMTAENANTFAEMMHQSGADSTGFATAFQGGDKAGAARIASDAAAKAARDALASQKEATELEQAKVAELTTRRDAMVASQGVKAKQGVEITEAERTALQGLDKELQDHKQSLADNSVAYEELAGDIDNVMIATQQYISVLRTQEDVMSRMSEMAGLVKANTPLQEMDRQAASLKQQVEFLTASRDKYAGSRVPEEQAVYTEINERIKRTQALYDATQDPFNRGLAARQGSMMQGVREGGYVGTAAGYGIDPAMKLLNERKALKDDLVRTEERLKTAEAGSTDEATLTGRKQQEINLLYENRLALLNREAEVQRDIRQLAMDQNKEFMRSFFGAGPAEMLQKLAVFRMAFDGQGRKRQDLSQGGFFSMDPAMRGNYGQLNPAFNPQMIELKNEQKRIADALAALAKAAAALVPATAGTATAGTPKTAPEISETATAMINLKSSAQVVADYMRGDFIQALRDVVAMVPGADHATHLTPTGSGQMGGRGGGPGYTQPVHVRGGRGGGAGPR